MNQEHGLQYNLEHGHKSRQVEEEMLRMKKKNTKREGKNKLKAFHSVIIKGNVRSLANKMEELELW